MKNKNILIPTDFSDNAWNAIRYGLELYKKTTCTFYLVHINPISVYSGGEAAMFESQELLEQGLLKESKEKLHKLLKEIERLPFNPKHTFHSFVQYGFFTDHIKQEVKNKNIELIVMVAKNLNFLQRILFRPTVEKISYRTKIPFLVLHE